MFLLVAVAASLVMAAYFLLKYTNRKADDEMLREFARMFPGECPVCSLHRFGVWFGHEAKNTSPPPHTCPSNKR